MLRDTPEVNLCLAVNLPASPFPSLTPQFAAMNFTDQVQTPVHNWSIVPNWSIVSSGHSAPVSLQADLIEPCSD